MITVHMVSSLDGYIAKKDNSIHWFETTSHYENGVEAENVEAFLKSIDCYVMGSHTYELAMELSKTYGWAYGETPTIVLSTRHFEDNRPHIKFYSGDLNHLVKDKLNPNYNHIWLVGGPSLVKDFLRIHQVDEIRQTIIPILLGDGIPFYQSLELERALSLKNVSPYKNGLVELVYEIKKPINQERA